MARTSNGMTQAIIVMMSALAVNADNRTAPAGATEAPTRPPNPVGNTGYPPILGTKNDIYVPKLDTPEEACMLCGGMIEVRCFAKANAMNVSNIHNGPAVQAENKASCYSCHCISFLTNHYDKDNPDTKLKWTFSCSTQVQARTYAQNRAGCACKNYKALYTVGSGGDEYTKDRSASDEPTTCEPFAPHSSGKFDASRYDWDNHVDDTTTEAPKSTSWMPENLKAVPLA